MKIYPNLGQQKYLRMTEKLLTLTLPRTTPIVVGNETDWLGK